MVALAFLNELLNALAAFVAKFGIAFRVELLFTRLSANFVAYLVPSSE